MLFATTRERSRRGPVQRRKGLNSCSHKRNAASSPLLMLPLELRKTIYEYALGGHLISVETDGRYRSSMRDAFKVAAKQKQRAALKHSICICADSSEACGEHLDQDCAETSPFFMGRRAPCAQNKLSLALLRTCWSVYEDAHLTHLSINCFSFRSGVDFVWFFQLELGAFQRAALREFHLRSSLGFPEVDLWDTALAPKVLSQLSGLRKIHISVTKPEGWLRPLQGGPLQSPDTWREDQWVQGFLALQYLPLSEVTVTLWSAVPNPPGDLPTSFEEPITEEAHAYANTLKHRILAKPNKNIFKMFLRD